MRTSRRAHCECRQNGSTAGRALRFWISHSHHCFPPIKTFFDQSKSDFFHSWMSLRNEIVVGESSRSDQTITKSTVCVGDSGRNTNGNPCPSELTLSDNTPSPAPAST